MSMVIGKPGKNPLPRKRHYIRRVYRQSDSLTIRLFRIILEEVRTEDTGKDLRNSLQELVDTEELWQARELLETASAKLMKRGKK